MSAGARPGDDPAHIEKLGRLFGIALSTVPPRVSALYLQLAALPHRFFSLGTAAGLSGWAEAGVRGALEELHGATLVDRSDRDGLRWSIRDTRPARDRVTAAGLGGDEYLSLVHKIVRYYLVRAAQADRALSCGDRGRAGDLAVILAGRHNPFAAGDRDSCWKAAWDWLQDEDMCLRAVVESAAENGLPEESWQLAECLMPFYRLHGGSPSGWARAARGGAGAARHCGRADAEALLRLDLALACQALEQPGQAKEQSAAAAGLVPAGAPPALRGRLEEVRGRLLAAEEPGSPGALRSYEAAAELYAEAGERNGEARALALASAALLGADPGRAAACTARALAIADDAGDPDRIAGQALVAAGEAQIALGQDREADALLRRAAQAGGASPRDAVRAWELLAGLAMQAGDTGAAEGCLRDAIEIAGGLGMHERAAALAEKLAGLGGGPR